MLKLIIGVVAALQLDTILRVGYTYLLDRRAHSIMKKRLEELHQLSDLDPRLDG